MAAGKAATRLASVEVASLIDNYPRRNGPRSSIECFSGPSGVQERIGRLPDPV
jgi:hypothetical protein